MKKQNRYALSLLEAPTSGRPKRSLENYRKKNYVFEVAFIYKILRGTQLCYATALNEAERPVITWVQGLGAYL